MIGSMLSLEERGFERKVTDRVFTVFFDTDVHGGISGLIAIKSLEGAGYSVVRFYSNFDRNPPATTPQAFADTIVQIVQPGRTNIVTLDIPIDVQRPLHFVNTLAEYTVMGRKVLFIDHHGHSEYTRMLFESGVDVAITETSYGMSLYLPRMLNVLDGELEMWSLIGATADFDETVADKITVDFEETVTEYVDTAWKFTLREIEEVKEQTPIYGNVGAIVKYLIDRNIGPEEFLELCRERGREVPLLQYEIKGNVAIARELPPTGLAWKCIAKILRVSNAPIGVIVSQTPRGISVIAVADWKRKSQYAPIVDEAVERIAKGRNVVGHTGAKSIFVASMDEARMLADELVRVLNELIETKMYTPRSTTFISDRYIAKALHQDFLAIQRQIAEILSLQTKMYQQYLELKKRQVELLEEMRRRETRAD